MASTSASVVEASGAPTANASAPATAPATTLDLNSDRQWRTACVLPLSRVAALAAPLGISLTTTVDGGQGQAIECSYSDPVTDDGIDAIDIQINAYDPTSTYGFLASGSGITWTAPDPASAYANACAVVVPANQGVVTCTRSAGSGIAVDNGDALVFAPGRYFYEISVLGVSQAAATNAVLQKVAQDVAGSGNLPK